MIDVIKLENGTNENRLTSDQQYCLHNMLDLYSVILKTSKDDKRELAVACAMIKSFLSYCYLDHKITTNDYDYISSFNILSSAVNHKAFYDILERKYLQ